MFLLTLDLNDGSVVYYHFCLPYRLDWMKTHGRLVFIKLYHLD